MQVIVEKTLNAPIEKIWALCADFGNIDWFKGNGVPGAEKVEVEGEGIGMARIIHMAGFDEPIKEVLTAMDPQNYNYSYDILPNPLMPFTDYKATGTLTALADGSTKATWRASFESDTLSAEDANAIMTGTYESMFKCLEAAAK